MPGIPLDQLRPRRLYRLRSRNLRLGVWRPEARGFVGVREKFDHRYLFVEYHHDIGAPFGTAWAVADRGVDVPDGMPVEEWLGTWCGTCRRPVHWSGPPAPAPWVHDDGDHGHAAVPKSIHNDALFLWLEGYEAKEEEE